MEKQSLAGSGGAYASARKTSRIRRNWQLMIYNQFGESIRVSHLQRYLIAVGVVMVGLLLATACLSFLYVQERSERLELQAASEITRGKISSLVSENDALMARLAVLAEKVAAAKAPDGSSVPEIGDEAVDAVADSPGRAGQ